MDHAEFLERVIRAGLASVETHDAITAHPARLRGARAGFEACRGKNTEELARLLMATRKESRAARLLIDRNPDTYWEKRYFELQVEHVTNTVAAKIWMHDQETWRSRYSTLFPSDLPTERGARSAERVLSGNAGLPVEPPSGGGKDR